MTGGWFKVYRKALDSWLWTLPAKQFKVAFTIMAMANWTQGHTMSGGEIVAVRRGQLMTSLPRLAEKSGESIRTVRTTINNLKKADFLTDEATNRFRLITIMNFALYQDAEDVSDSQSDRPATGQRQASDRPATAIEEGKKEKKGKKRGDPLPLFGTDQPEPEQEKPSTHPEREAIISGFHELFMAHTGSKPAWRPKERGIANALAKFGADEVLRRAAVMFELAPKFPADHPDLPTLSAHWDKFAGAGKRQTAGDLEELAWRAANGGRPPT